MDANRQRVHIRRSRIVSRNANDQIYCTHQDCQPLPPTFSRLCEWNKHMDKHDRPFKCHEPDCNRDRGFTYAGGLSRRQREVHKKTSWTADHVTLRRLRSQFRGRVYAAGDLASTPTPSASTHQRPEMTANLLDDLNFATACRVAFAGFLRLGEFTYKTEDLNTGSIFSATKLTRSDIRFSSSLDHVQLTLKRSKTDRRHEGIQIVLAKTGEEACPVDALQKLLLLDPKMALTMIQAGFCGSFCSMVVELGRVSRGSIYSRHDGLRIWPQEPFLIEKALTP